MNHRTNRRHTDQQRLRQQPRPYQPQGSYPQSDPRLSDPRTVETERFSLQHDQRQMHEQDRASYQQQYDLQAQYRNHGSHKKSRRPLLLLSGLLFVAFLATTFMLRNQIIAPEITTQDNVLTAGTENGLIDAVQDVGAGAQSVIESLSTGTEAEQESTANDNELAIESGKGDLSDSQTADLAKPLSDLNSDKLTVADSIENAQSNAQSNTIVIDGGASPQTINGLQPGTRFRIDERVGNEKVANILFALRSAEVQADQLILTAAFENAVSKATRFSHIDAVPLEQIRLVDADGTAYPALTADQSFLAIQPQNGFAPSGANIGTITFARPTGLGPFTLSGIHDYPAVAIREEMYLNATVTLPAEEGVSTAFVPEGIYPIDTQVLSSLEELEPLVLHVRTIDLTEDTISLHIGFSNNTLQQFGLLSGPSGSNAWLLDRVNRQYAPRTVSDSLRNLITPEQGIPPGEEHQGVLTFSRPADLSELQFVLEPYTPVTVRFGPAGLSEVLNTAPTDTAVAATPSTSSGVQAYREISTLLEQTANAVMARNQPAYLAAFSDNMKPLQAAYIERLGRLNVTNFQMKILLPPQLEGVDIQSTALVDTPALNAQIRYNLNGISVDNPFVYDFLIELRRMDGRWLITKLEPERNHPFWWRDDFSLFETEHFLILTRPNSVQNLQTLQTEVETAYATLTNLGLTLEQKYVAYFTGANESLYALTNMANTHLVGVALSRYDINGLDTSTGERTINAINRAFYVNSEQFTQNQAGGGSAQNTILRQSIITHELVHLAFSHDARPFTPPWISEGIAVYYSDQFVLDDARRLAQEGQFNQLTLAEMTGLETLGDHDIVGQQTEMRYIYSGAAIRYLIETYGEARVQALFRSYATVEADYIEERMPDEQDNWTTRSVFRTMSIELTENYIPQQFGLTLTELDQRVKAWLQSGL